MAKPRAGQFVCYLVEDEIENIYYDHEDDRNLYVNTRAGLPPLGSESGPVKLDTCRVYLKEQLHIAKCNLSHPQATLRIEGGGKELGKTLTLCVSTTTTAPMTAPPPGGDTGRIVGGVLGGLVAVVVVVVAAAVVLYILWKRSKSCRHKRVKTGSGEQDETEQTGELSVANGNALTSPC